MENEENPEPRQPSFQCPYCDYMRYGMIAGFGGALHIMEEHSLEGALAHIGRSGPEWRHRRAGHAAAAFKVKLCEVHGLMAVPDPDREQVCQNLLCTRVKEEMEDLPVFEGLSGKPLSHALGILDREVPSWRSPYVWGQPRRLKIELCRRLGLLVLTEEDREEVRSAICVRRPPEIPLYRFCPRPETS
jgi:hypothetical protein